MALDVEEEEEEEDEGQDREVSVCAASLMECLCRMEIVAGVLVPPLKLIRTH